jgi:hypothetical protein
MKPVHPASLVTETLALSVRETRMIVERILLACGLPDGLVPAVRDCVLYSQALGQGGLALLQQDLAVLQEAKPHAMGLEDDGGTRLVLDGAGQHAWIAAPAALDLALDRYRSRGDGEVVVVNVAAGEELRVLAGLAGRYGARATVSDVSGRPGHAVRVTADGLAETDAVFEAACQHGLRVPHRLWQDLYALSHQALTPDSIESRRHAGPVMVDAQGRIHGRDDDDTDFTLLGVNAALAGREDA